MHGITTQFILSCTQQLRACMRGLFLLAILSCTAVHSYAYKEEKTLPTTTNNVSNSAYDPDPNAPPFDETSIFLSVQRIGGIEVAAVIKDRNVYLPITSLFDFLKIKADATPNFDSVYGYFIDPKAKYCIDNIKYQIHYQGTVYQLKPSDLIQTESNLYLRNEYFNQVFGLTSTFDFSNLTVKMSATVELPAVREMQLEQMHRNVSRLKGEVKADTTIGRKYPFFNLGFADWNIAATQQSEGGSDLRAGLALGAVIAGGEADVFLNYSDKLPFNERQQFYQWRFANNAHKGLRQVTVGRIFTQATASIYDPVVGVQITNSPTTYRKSAGSYRLSRTTQPGWTVELYVNNVLIDFVKADASGFFSFDVPLVYGNSLIKLRYYGLYGEERTSEENITIPFNFLPKHEVEYTASAGFVEDSLNSRIGRVNVNYGLSRFITIGAGTEYLSSVKSGPNMPFATASMRLAPNLLVSMDYMYGVRTKGVLSYRMPHSAQLELNYIKYAPGQTALFYNYLDERKLIYSIPFNVKRISGVTRLMISQIKLTENTSYNAAEWLVSGNLKNFGLNINTYLTSSGQKDPPRFDPYVFSNASISYRFGKGWTLSPQAQYSYKDGAFISAKCELEKYLFRKGYLNIAYEQNFSRDQYSVGVGMRYDLSFARTNFATRQGTEGTTYTESASGSLVFDIKNRYVGTSNRQSVGHAGITIVAYLDINGNGQRDAGEPKLAGLRPGINSGRVQYSATDTVIRMYDLEPYTNYFIDLSQNSFENISWQTKTKTMNVVVDPNQLKVIEVPVLVMSEANGTVYYQDGSSKRPQSRINIGFYRPDGSKVANVLSDQDGYYSYMGLAPGTYTIRIDKDQLNNLHMTGSAEKTITIKATTEGSLEEGLDFFVRRAAEEK